MAASCEGTDGRETGLTFEDRARNHQRDRILWTNKWRKRIGITCAVNIWIVLGIEIALSQIWPEEAWYFIFGQFSLQLINIGVQIWLLNGGRLDRRFNRRYPLEF